MCWILYFIQSYGTTVEESFVQCIVVQCGGVAIYKISRDNLGELVVGDPPNKLFQSAINCVVVLVFGQSTSASVAFAHLSPAFSCSSDPTDYTNQP